MAYSLKFSRLNRKTYKLFYGQVARPYLTRFSIEVDDELAIEFRVKAVRRKLKLNDAFKEAMKCWLKEN
jgi:hypothetical protein